MPANTCAQKLLRLSAVPRQLVSLALRLEWSQSVTHTHACTHTNTHIRTCTHTHTHTHLLLSSDNSPSTSPRVSGLHLQDRPEQALRSGCKESDLGIGMEAVEIGAFRRQAVVNVAVVAQVVGAGGLGEARGIDQLTVQLKRERRFYYGQLVVWSHAQCVTFHSHCID